MYTRGGPPVGRDGMKTVDSKTFARPQTSPLLARLLLVTLALAPAGQGCGKVAAERAENQALAQAAAAIEHYSVASDQANASHHLVMVAFAKANAATNLADYKALLRADVLNALDGFVAKLAAMPTETKELKLIHAKLVEAYKHARDRIADFERDLQDPSSLGQFNGIRKDLQDAVNAYKLELNQYYAKNKRQLRLDGRPPTAVAPASAATPTTAPAAVTASAP